ncbi:hypothetical protein [uncultured Agrobacterium sp.]|nr:hypothetical protein [uncultured Agrobacterium sp.]
MQDLNFEEIELVAGGETTTDSSDPFQWDGGGLGGTGPYNPLPQQQV